MMKYLPLSWAMKFGHIEKRHTVHQIEKQMALSLLTILAGAASGDPGAGLALASTVSSAHGKLQSGR